MTQAGLFRTPLFKQSMKDQGTNGRVLLKWFVPGFLTGCCIFISMWLLHIATYKYVHRMTSMDAAVSKLTSSAAEEAKVVAKFGVDKDVVGDLFPFDKIPLTILDSVAAIFPATFMLGVVWKDDLRLYTKILICNAFLALLKGSIDSMTIIPDSSGWQSCQDRLTPLGVSYMQEEHSYWDLFIMEVVGVQGHRLRWCADMMVSGHTYFTTTYALGLYELVRKHGPKGNGLYFAVAFIFALTVGEQLVEVYVVTVDRFHYTMDVYMAIIVTFLIYTNVVPARLAKWWWRMKKHMDKDEQLLMFKPQSEVLVPVCCVPFCCIAGYEHTYDDEHLKYVFEKAGSLTPAQIEFLKNDELMTGRGLKFPLLGFEI